MIRQEARNEHAAMDKRISLLVGQLEETKAQLETTEKAYKSTHVELTEAVERISELSNSASTLQAAKRKVDSELQTAHVYTTFNTFISKSVSKYHAQFYTIPLPLTMGATTGGRGSGPQNVDGPPTFYVVF